ncbi:hypothetical protein SCHPADRAFT_348508 [Schizopora paradoxa]|uniref:Uncharacterized protein n=1 Tax=Schizopora paradoxa TaxID=27342 RepID=A0A0H2RW80_9AGAM|nr:hypothetical protein SCHPADRAFT_348508 [Schizopora paradoxa]
MVDIVSGEPTANEPRASDQLKPSDVGNVPKYLKTTMSKPTLCFQGQLPLYDFPHAESLYAICHTYLDHVENIQLNQWHNNSDSPQQYALQCTYGFIADSGALLSESINLCATFKGLSVGVETDGKTFTSTETTESKVCSVQVTVSPNSDLWLYQRRYVFHTKMTWILDAWGGLWNVGSKRGYHVQEGTCVIHIDTLDFITTKTKLAGEQTVLWPSETWDSLKTVSARVANQTKEWLDLTEKCRSSLEKIGIDGSQQV